MNCGGAEEKGVLGDSSNKRTVKEVTAALAPSIEKRYQPKQLAELTDGGEILLVAIKDEHRLELWKRPRGAKQHAHVLDFPWTATSGKPGPKLREGDRQIPEGVYRLEYLNPNSRYHLSMKIDYPNAFDRARGKEDGRRNLGGDIMIHGRAVTIGCIPLGNPGIEHLFYLVARNGLGNVRVIITPTDFRKSNPAPEIDGIDWEDDLYGIVRKALREVTAE